MSRKASPFDLLFTAHRMWWLAAETNAVMAMRLMGMGGMWNVTKGEDARMWNEKPAAFQQSAIAATTAMMSGKRPDQIVDAAMRPLGRKVSANRRRLAKRGPLGKGQS